MKIKNIITAIRTGTFDSTVRKDFGSTTNFKLGDLKRKIMPVLDNYNEQRTKLLEKYGVENADNPGSFNFETAENKQLFNDEIKKLEEIDVEIAPPEITIIDGFGITGSDIYDLDGVINFALDEPKPKAKSKK